MNSIQYVPTLLDSKPDGIKESKNRFEKNKAAFTVFYAWIVAFFIMEPLTSLLLFNDKKSPTFLTLITDFSYASIPFIKSMYIYKNVFKNVYFPEKMQDIPLFISIYVALQLVLDAIFLITMAKTRSVSYPLQNLLSRYDGVTKMSHSVNVTTYGIIWIFLTYLVYTKLQPLDTISIIIASLFLMLLLEYPDKAFTTK